MRGREISMGNKWSRKKVAVDERYTKPQGLYHKDLDHKKLRKFILDSKLAPCYPPVQDLEQCSVCSVYYPSLNRSRCCMVGICTECFLQIKPSNHPTQCPFCETYNYAVEYRGVRTKEHKTIEQVEEQRVIEESTQTRLETTSSSRLPSQLRQNRVDLPEKLKSMTEHQEVQKSSASLNLVEILMRELVFEKAKRYSFDELTTFTSGFDNKIGTGAFGNVYKGRFSDGVQVAVKVLKTNDFVQHSFLTEIRTMTKVHHQNLVRFFGFCLEDHVLALVYEYMENGSLDKILAKKPLSIEWDKLYAIAVELATALSYLHHDCKDQIIHHDVKPANVLLDSSHSPKLTDFGLANLMDTERTHLTLSKSKGTPGFAAPEIWMPFSPITSKCDVFGFGMILFEILGMERNSLTDIWFPSHVWQKLNEGKLINVIMERGISDKDAQKATILSVVALWCVQFTPQTRPSMKTIVTVLKNVIPVNKPPNPMLPSDLSVSMQLVQSS